MWRAGAVGRDALFLGVLAAYGYQALAYGRARPIRAALAAILAAAVLAEYRVIARSNSYGMTA